MDDETQLKFEKTAAAILLLQKQIRNNESNTKQLWKHFEKISDLATRLTGHLEDTLVKLSHR